MSARIGFFAPLLAAFALACAPTAPNPTRLSPAREGVIKVRNQHPDGVVLYPSVAGSTIWTRIGRIPPNTTRTVKLDRGYLRAGFQLVICRGSGAMGTEDCVRTNAFGGDGPSPEVVIFPTLRLRAELFGGGRSD